MILSILWLIMLTVAAFYCAIMVAAEDNNPVWIIVVILGALFTIAWMVSVSEYKDSLLTVDHTWSMVNIKRQSTDNFLTNQTIMLEDWKTICK